MAHAPARRADADAEDDAPGEDAARVGYPRRAVEDPPSPDKDGDSARLDPRERAPEVPASRRGRVDPTQATLDPSAATRTRARVDRPPARAAPITGAETRVGAELATRDTLALDDDAEGERGPAVDGDITPSAQADSFVERRMRSRVMARLFDRRERLKIGRYDILESIGHGGMGVVYAAFDDELDRKVAIKLLLSEASQSDNAKLRFKREAQAMARLSHPNVVTVHEVGEADGRVFIAMEFVRGASLDAYCEAPRPWEEVVDIFVQAGRGLIAAHEAGIIHRDLKPHNIIRGDDGVVKVLDFGLARAEDPRGDLDPATPQVDRPGSRSSVLGLKLTNAGALVGTPAYMAPELFGDSEADVRSDQYSFCVALYEALYAQLPFAGSTLDALLSNIGQGAIRPAPPGSKVPGWVHRTIVRGLDARPDRRWPSMRALVEALSRDPRRTRRRLIAGFTLAALTGAAGFALADLRAPAQASCASAADDLAEVWSDARRERVAQAFAASGHRLAADAAVRVLPRVDAYAARWSTMRVDACETHLAGQQSDRLFDLRTACLDRRRAGLGALVDALEGADPAAVEGSAWAVANLPALAGCADVEALTAEVAPPEDPAVRGEVRRLRERLAGVPALVDVGAYEEAIGRAEAVRERADALAYAPLSAEAHLRLGAAELEAHLPERARDSLSAAIEAAVRAGQDDVAAEALARRLWVLAELFDQADLGLHDAPLAEAFVDRLGDRLLPRWLLANNRGAALYRSGATDEAERAYRQALEILAESDEAPPIESISTRMNLALLLYTSGRPATAAVELRDARRRAIDLLGADHPRVAYFTHMLVLCLNESGRLREGIELLGDSLDRLDASASYLRASHRVLLALLHLERRDYARARADAEAALALADANFPEDRVRALALQLRGAARIAEGEAQAGLADLRGALAATLARAGAESHEDVGHARWWLGTGIARAGDLEGGIAEVARALAIYGEQGRSAPPLVSRHAYRLVELLLEAGALERAAEALTTGLAAADAAGLAADNLHRATLRKLRGELALARGDLAAARDDLGPACAALERVHEVDDPTLASCRLAWSRALGDTERARALADAAREAYAALGLGFAAEREAAAARAGTRALP